jgi:pilus assembly protein CpaE
MIAVNLALLLRQQTSKGILLVDARRALGDLDTMLNLVPTSTLADLGPDASDVDVGLLKALLIKHTSGVHVLLSPQKLDEGKIPSPEGFDHVLKIARQAFDYIIIDGGPLSDPYTTIVLEHADQILLVIVPEMPALQRAALFIETARRHGFPPERLSVVVNRATARGGITHQSIQERLRTEAAFVIPDDVHLATYSINQGIPLVVSHPRSPMAQSLAEMAQRLISRDSRESTATDQAEGLRRISQKLRGLWRSG